MSPRQPLLLATLLCPAVQSQAEVLPQRYDYSYQYYQEDDERIKVESHYLRGQIELNDATSFHFQWLNDAISGASPTGALPGGPHPYTSDVEDVRTGILGAISRQFGDHRVELELSRSKEDDYDSRGVALSDAWELNQKNTTFSYGFNYLDDLVMVNGANRDKHSYDLFTGLSQILDKNTLVSANLTLGYSEGYLNDPYKALQRTELVPVLDGNGDPILDGNGDPLVVSTPLLYAENRPDTRFRQVLQFGARHYFEPANGALDSVLRLGHDDFGVLSETLQLEWRQDIGSRFQAVPFFRYAHQSAADFFVKSLDGMAVTPSADPDGSGPNYSADYRLSSFDAVSGGLRLRYQFDDHFSATAAYERYVMSGSGDSADQSQDAAYPSADIWTFGLSAQF